ncbi:MAG: leucine-rich repeat protein, partial [Ruminococcus sp.]
MKRIINTLILIISLIVFAVIFTFPGCGSKSDSTSETTKEETSTVETKSTPGQINEEDLTPSQGLEFRSNGDGTCKIVGIGECKDKDIVIPTVSPTGDKVTLICNNAFANLSGVNSVTFLNYNYKVGQQAFKSGKFTTLNVIGGSPIIQKKAFISCDKLTSIYFKSCTVEVGEKAFLDCGKNATVTFYDCTSTIKEKAFYSCPLLSFSIRGGKTTVGDSAFAFCEDLSDIIFSNSEVKASDCAFYGCGNLADVEATKSSVVLGDRAF